MKSNKNDIEGRASAPCSPSSLTPETDAMIAADQHHLEDDNFFPAATVPAPAPETAKLIPILKQ